MAAPRSPGRAVRPRTLPGWPRAPLSVLSPSLEAQGPGPAGPHLRFWKAFPRGILARPGRDRDTRAQEGTGGGLVTVPFRKAGTGGRTEHVDIRIASWYPADPCLCLLTPPPNTPSG